MVNNLHMSGLGLCVIAAISESVVFAYLKHNGMHSSGGYKCSQCAHAIMKLMRVL